MAIPRTALTLILVLSFAAVVPAVAGSIDITPSSQDPVFGQDSGVPSLAADDPATNLGGLVTNDSTSIFEVPNESELPIDGFTGPDSFTGEAGAMSYFVTLPVVELSLAAPAPEPSTTVLVLLGGAILLLAMRQKRGTRLRGI